jgi:hypothetical protein
MSELDSRLIQNDTSLNQQLEANADLKLDLESAVQRQEKIRKKKTGKN